MLDRRKTMRVPVRKPARVHCRSLKKPLKCTITDLSSAGARLLFRSEVTLRPAVILIVPGDNLKLDATTRWTRGKTCGVEFKQKIAHPCLTEHRMGRAGKSLPATDGETLP